MSPQRHAHAKRRSRTDAFQRRVSKEKSPTAARFMAVIGLLFGLSFGWFTGEKQWHWCLAGGLSGLLLGYLFGRAIDRSLRG